MQADNGQKGAARVMYAGMPSRRWCREVLATRQLVSDLVGKGLPLTDPQIVRASRRLDRLMLAACTLPARNSLSPPPVTR